jgi:hypothetical protein
MVLLAEGNEITGLLCSQIPVGPMMELIAMAPADIALMLSAGISLPVSLDLLPVLRLEVVVIGVESKLSTALLDIDVGHYFG